MKKKLSKKNICNYMLEIYGTMYENEFNIYIKHLTNCSVCKDEYISKY